MTARRLAAFALVILALAPCAYACTATSARIGETPALIVAYPAGLTELRTDGSQPDMLVPAGADGVPRIPAVSPDGSRIAYLLGPPPGTPAADTGADVWLADRDGSHRRRLLTHPRPNHSFRQVAWEDPDHLLVVVDVPATCDGCNPETTTMQRLERLDISSGDVTTVRDGVRELGLSPDARSIAFPLPGNDRAEGLQVGALDAAGPVPVVVPLDAGFAQITSPRYSPDGSRIAFAAAHARTLRAGFQPVSLALAPNAGPLPDGLPQDIWIADADGSHLRILAPLRESAPVLAWDPDGSTIYAVGAVALYRIDVSSGEVTRIGRGAAGASLAYAPPAR